jgi:ribose-phosphate pyrophosphokinase
MFYEKIKYPDGSFYVIVKDFPKEFTFKINSYEDLWILNQLRDVYKHNGKNATITIPCLFEAQADRRFHTTDPAGLKLVCDFINKMSWEKVRIFHPHNPEVVEALIDNVKIIDNSNFIMEVLKLIQPDKITQVYTLSGSYKELAKDFNYNNLTLMSSDAGGFKPLMKLCDKIGWQGETFSASKSRQYVDNKSKLIQQVDRNDFGGKDILIIDDICVYGGTFIGLAKMLRERNCGKLYLAVSHITVELPNPELFSLFDKVFTTNSKYDAYFPIPHYDHGGGSQAKNLEIIKLF